MALALYGGGILDARGSVGGNTFSRSKYGATIRAKTSPLQPRTDFQTIARVRLQSISNAWSQVLSDAERSQWNAFALTQPQTNRFGNISYLSGQQWFNKLSNNLALLGLPPVTTPPASGSFPGATSFVISASHAAGGDVARTIVGSPVAGVPYCVVYCTQCVTAGTYYVNSALKLVYNEPAIDGTASFTPAYKTRIGNYAPITGLKIFAMARWINANNGTSSAPIIASCIVT